MWMCCAHLDCVYQLSFIILSLRERDTCPSYMFMFGEGKCLIEYIIMKGEYHRAHIGFIVSSLGYTRM